MTKTTTEEQRSERKSLRIPLSGYPAMLAILALSFLLIYSSSVKADPAGAQITTNQTETALATAADNRTDAGGTITTLTLSATQQNTNWKAYLGNVTGILTLDDASQNTIFQWSLSGTAIVGEIYVSRNSSVSWGAVNCSVQDKIYEEDSFLGMSNTSTDSINRTFNETVHPAITVAGRTIIQDSCRSTATWINDTVQSAVNSVFPEVVLASEQGVGSVVYTAPLHDDVNSFNQGQIVDFQLIVPDDATTAITTYYFYVEIGA